MPVLRSLAPALVFASTLLTPLVAEACWDGVRIETGRIMVMITEDDHGALIWPDAESRADVADWLVAIEALLPPEEALIVEAGFVNFDPGSSCAAIDEVSSFAELFDEVGRACGRTPREIEQALALTASPYTVQILSTRDREAAEARAEQLDLSCSWHGFYERGGFPALNPCAEIEVATLADGRTVYRVLVGSFLTRASAEQAQAEIRMDHGVDGLVRRLRP